MRFILENRDGSRPVRIVCPQWWSYWPAKYLAFDAASAEVLTWGEWQRVVGVEGPRGTEETWFIEFADAACAQPELREYEAGGLTILRKTVLDYAGEQVILVFGPTEKFSQNY